MEFSDISGFYNLILFATKFPTIKPCTFSFYFSYFSRFFQKTSQAPEFNRIFWPYLRNHRYDYFHFWRLTNSPHLKEINQNRWRCTQFTRRTRTHNFFSCLSDSLGSWSMEYSYFGVSNRNDPNVSLRPPIFMLSEFSKH